MIKPQQLRFTAIFLTLCSLSSLIGSCKTSSAKPSNSYLQDAYYDCGVDGMAQRRAGAIERSKSCAVDAIGIGLAETIQTAAMAAGEARAIANAIKAFNQLNKTAKFNINIAKGTLCAETLLGGLALTEVTKFTTDQFVILGITPDAEYNSLTTLIANISTVGGFDAFAALGSFVTTPNIENAITFGTKSFGSLGDMRQLLTSCSQVFTSVLQVQQVSTIHLAKLAKVLGRIGVMGALSNCSAAGLFNAIDVGTELNCLVQDLHYIEEQNKKILGKERNRCEGLSEIAALPTSRPALAEIRNTIDSETGRLDAASETRATLCYAIIDRWGRCLASHPIALRSQGYCQKLCTRASITTNEDFNRVAAKTGFTDPREIVGLVTNAVEYCTSEGNPAPLVNNGIQPCVNLCMQGTGGLTNDAVHSDQPF